MITNYQCHVCGEYCFGNKAGHTCPPRWDVCDEECQTEVDYEWDPIFARDPAQAAELFCERWDRSSSEYQYIKDEQSEILVRGVDGTIHRLTVTAYMEPTYSASPSLTVRGT